MEQKRAKSSTADRTMRRRWHWQALLLMAIWLFLSGHYDAFHIALGVISVLLVLFINHDLRLYSGTRAPDTHHPVRPLRVAGYLLWLAKEMILSAIDVARVILSPRMPLRPALMRFRSRQPNDLARVILGNSITLTPGTLTVDVQGDVFAVHSLTEATENTLLNGRMQGKVARLFADEEHAEMVEDVEWIHPAKKNE